MLTTWHRAYGGLNFKIILIMFVLGGREAAPLSATRHLLHHYR